MAISGRRCHDQSGARRMLAGHMNHAERGSIWNRTPGTRCMQTVRKTLRQGGEAAAEASYETRRVRSGGKPRQDRSAEDRRGYEKAIAAAFELLPTSGHAVKPSRPSGDVAGH